VEQVDTRTRILDAAQELIQRLGANAMSYQHISEVVGIRKASIHHHFPTKEDLLQAVLERYSRFFLGLVDTIVTSDARPAKKLAAYVDLFDATLSESKSEKACLCGMLGAELATLGSASVGLIERFYEQNEGRLTQILDEGRRSGDFQFFGSSKAMSALIFALLEGAILIARAKGGRRQLKTISDQLMHLICRGP
jgi:TetR/AcrR family transcriptional regulator, transcriptional repressor for nem operon